MRFPPINNLLPTTASHEPVPSHEATASDSTITRIMEKVRQNEDVWLGKFLKVIDKDCYNQCKNKHGIKGFSCFSVCVAAQVALKK